MEQVVYRKQSNCVYHCHYHIVIVTKYRKKIFNAGIYGFLARDLKKTYPFLKKCYFGTESVCSDGYFVSTVGINEAVIQRYIEHQGREDMGQAWLRISRWSFISKPQPP